MDVVDLLLLEQLLLVVEDLPEEVLVDLRDGREKVLDCKDIRYVDVGTYGAYRGKHRNLLWIGASQLAEKA